jgi:hypothetical protein
MDRPLQEVRLPVSQKTVKIVTYFLRGEVKAIDAMKYEGAKAKFVDGQTVIDEIPVDFLAKEEDGLLLHGVKAIVDDNGNETPVNKKTLDELPDHDLGVLLRELRKAQAGKNIEMPEGEALSKKK